MQNQGYKRTLEELRNFAFMFWPSELSLFYFSISLSH